jgi:hypothetical protein
MRDCNGHPVADAAQSPAGVTAALARDQIEGVTVDKRLAEQPASLIPIPDLRSLETSHVLQTRAARVAAERRAGDVVCNHVVR